MSADTMGGVWTYALELARGLDRLGIDVHLAILGPAPSPAQRREARRIRSLEMTITGLPLDWTARDAAALAEVPEALQALALGCGADMVHLNAPAHAGAARWPIALTIAAHSCVATWWRATRGGPLPDDLAWRAHHTGAGLAVADAVIAPSYSFKRALVRAYGTGLDVLPVPNGMAWRGGEPRAEKRHVLTAGRLWDPAKDAATIDAAAGISGVMVHAAGPTCGPNGEQIALPHLALLGTLSSQELAPWYASTAVLIAASRYEPFGLAALQAAQAGAALVLSDIETFRELWDGAALFFPAGDADALADALTRLSVDTPQRQQLASRARARARRWSADRMVIGTLGAYAHAQAVHARRHPPRSAA
jgi:glycosyltransferase involved in cell wall biosynthesis